MPHPQQATRHLVHVHLPFIFSRLLARFVKVEHMSSKVPLSTPFHKDHAEVTFSWKTWSAACTTIIITASGYVFQLSPS